MISMLFDGMVVRGVTNPDGDRQAIVRVLRSTLRHLLAEPCGDRVS
ncbi:MAG: hypothetical protein JHD15_26340 [Phenylobacterium sp.]|nr:hypothetical protein [Phenylobacterium sp.]